MLCYDLWSPEQFWPPYLRGGSKTAFDKVAYIYITSMRKGGSLQYTTAQYSLISLTNNTDVSYRITQVNQVMTTHVKTTYTKQAKD